LSRDEKDRIGGIIEGEMGSQMFLVSLLSARRPIDALRTPEKGDTGLVVFKKDVDF
jgi:hypothetical protein